MPAKKPAPKSESEIVQKMENLEKDLKAREEAGVGRGVLRVNGPLPPDFNANFAKAIAQATGCHPNDVKIVSTKDVTPALLQLAPAIIEVTYEAPKNVVQEVQGQAGDPSSPLANGLLREFLIAKGQGGDLPPPPVHQPGEKPPHQFDVDTEMPFGELEPFGREDTAQELTQQSINESNEMVDQMERAEVAEEKRAVFRALTRLRGAAITSFDGVARSHTGNIDEYSKTHQWRAVHPIHHLAQEENDVHKWAFPDTADF